MDAAAQILVVDDEPRALELVVRTLRKVGRVTTAASGDEALGMIEATAYDLVISDQRMPGLTGVDLLSQVAERSENCGRILLTGYADLSTTIEAINRGRVHAYLHKPCSPEELRVSALNVLARAQLARENARLVAVVTELRSALAAAQAAADVEAGAEKPLATDRIERICRDLLDAEPDR